MGAENLDERNFERGDLAVQEDAGQIELNLETDIDVGAIDLRTQQSARFMTISRKQGISQSTTMYQAPIEMHNPLSEHITSTECAQTACSQWMATSIGIHRAL